jgi:membrane-associated phospholipid phosphatase
VAGARELDLRCACICALGFVALFGASYGVDPARRLDATVLDGFMALRGGWVSALGRVANDLGSPLFATPVAAALLALGLLGGRRRQTAAAAVLLVAAPLASQVLKKALAQYRIPADFEHLHVAAAAFPSGHAATAMALAVAGALVAPSGRRGVAVAAGSSFAVAVGFGTLMSGNHLPSDVLAAYLLAGGCCFLARAALAPGDPEKAWPALGASSAVAGGVALVAVLSALVRSGTEEALFDHAGRTAALAAGAGTLTFVASLLPPTFVTQKGSRGPC